MRAGASGCPAGTKRGEPCRAPLLPTGRYCAFHDPALAGQRAEARSRGAVASNKLRAIKGRRAQLDSATALVKFLSELVHDAVDGTTPPDVARVVFYGVSVLRQAIETGDLERRVAELETAAATRSVPRRIA